MTSSLLKEPSSLFGMIAIFTGGLVGSSGLWKRGPLSVPESHGGRYFISAMLRHDQLLQRFMLSIPTNQSGDGASMEMADTIGCIPSTSTLTVSSPRELKFLPWNICRM